MCSIRCGSGRNRRNPSPTASGDTPYARASAAAASALATLCGANGRTSSRRASSAASRTGSAVKARSTRRSSTTPRLPGAGTPRVKPTERSARSPRRVDHSSSAFTTASVPGAKIFPLSAAYASSEPCQSRWSGATLSTAAARGVTVEDQCSWKLDSSTASTSYGAPAASPGPAPEAGPEPPTPATTSTMGVPTLPTSIVRWPAASSMRASIRTTVVLPSVPVTASHGGASGPRSRHASSTSPITSTPVLTAASSSGAVGRQPGDVTTSSASGGSVSPSPSRRVTPGTAARVRRPSSSRASTRVTCAPRSASTRAAARPEIPAPATQTRRPAQAPVMTWASIRCRTAPGRWPRTIGRSARSARRWWSRPSRTARSGAEAGPS